MWFCAVLIYLWPAISYIIVFVGRVFSTQVFVFMSLKQKMLMLMLGQSYLNAKMILFGRWTAHPHSVMEPKQHRIHTVQPSLFKQRNVHVCRFALYPFINDCLCLYPRMSVKQVAFWTEDETKGARRNIGVRTFCHLAGNPISILHIWCTISRHFFSFKSLLWRTGSLLFYIEQHPERKHCACALTHWAVMLVD